MELSKPSIGPIDLRTIESELTVNSVLKFAEAVVKESFLSFQRGHGYTTAGNTLRYVYMAGLKRLLGKGKPLTIAESRTLNNFTNL